VIRRAGLFLAALTVFALVAPWLAPYEAGDAFREFLHAPPMRPHLDGLSPVVHPLVLADRLEQRFEPDRSRTVKLPWVRHEFFFAPDIVAFRVPALGWRAAGSVTAMF